MSGVSATASTGLLSISGLPVTVALVGRLATTQAGFLGHTTTIGMIGRVGSSGFGRASGTTLSSQLATGGFGLLTQGLAMPLVGRSSASAVGILTASTGSGLVLSGQAATSAVGTMAPSSSQLLQGTVATPTSGSVSTGSPLNVGLAGQNSSGDLGNLTWGDAVTLAGRQASAAIGSIVPQVSTGLTGTSATSAYANLVYTKYQITVTWTKSTDPGVTRYYVGWSTSTHAAATSITAYENVVDAGDVASYTIRGLSNQVYYYNVSAAGPGGHDTFESFIGTEVAAVPHVELNGVLAIGAVGALSIAKTVGLLTRLATAQRGNMTAQNANASVTIAGQAVVGQLGTLVPTTSFALTGVAASAARGFVSGVSPSTLVGASATGEVGVLGVESGVSIAGTTAQSGYGTMVFQMADDRYATPTGQESIVVAGLLAPGSVVGLAGVGASGEVGTLVVAKSGTVALTGVSATARQGQMQKLNTGGGGDDNYDEVILRRRRR